MPIVRQAATLHLQPTRQGFALAQAAAEEAIASICFHRAIHFRVAR